MLGIVHLPNFYLKRRFGDWTLSPPSRKKRILLGPEIGKALSIGPIYLKTDASSSIRNVV
jgi:hypothetical protein